MKKILIFLFLFLTACSKKEISPVGHSFETEFKNQEITLTLHTDGRFSGQVTNDYFGEFKINGNKIQFDLQGSTMKMAPTPRLKSENEYFKDLKTIHSFSWNNKVLILKGNSFNYLFYPLDSNQMDVH